MLDEHEKRMAKGLLEFLPSHDVMSLAQTVTQNKVLCTSHSGTSSTHWGIITTEDEIIDANICCCLHENRWIKYLELHEAVQAVADYTDSGMELLKRKKLTKDILFQYLHKEQVPIRPSAEKQVYIDAILSHWRKTRSPMKSVALAPAKVSPVRMHPEPVSIAAQQNNFHQTVQHITVQHNVYQQNITNNINITSPTQTVTSPPAQHQQFGENFVSWFYKMLNSCTTAGTEFGPQHFFPDCKMNVLIASNGLQSNPPPENCVRSEVVCKRLSRFVHEDGVEFHPNVCGEGVQCVESGQEEMHIRACGMVLKQMQKVGVFEQQFRVLRDVGLGNNWRIKSTNIGLSTTIPQQTVTLAITGGLPALE